MNQFVRIARISKLYKLVKITKLIKIIKVIKNKKKLEQKFNQMVKSGAAYDRLLFFLLIVFLMSHFMACLWVFIASSDPFEETEDHGTNWIIASEFEDLKLMELYAASMYFTMQTLTTVGYGDITVSTPLERLMCILLQFIGVIFFSFASGSLTNII